MRLDLSAATMLLAVSTAASAQITPASGAPTTATATAAAPAKPKPICRREQVIGSNLPQRTCHSAEEWKQIDNPSTEERRIRAGKIRPSV